MSFNKIMIPVDGSIHSNVAVDTGLELAKDIGKNVTILFVKDKNTSDDTAANIIKHAVNRGNNLDVIIEESSISGNPAEIIIKESANYDIIVMGTRGKGALSKAFAGSVTQKVIKESMCPTIVVKNLEVVN